MRIFPTGPTDADVQARVDAAVAALLGGANFTGLLQAPSVKIEPPEGPDLVTNGNFETSANWTFATGWVWTEGAAHKNATGWQSVSQSSAIPYIDTERFFRIRFTVFDRTAGSVTPILAGYHGTEVSSNGDHEQVIRVSYAGGSVAFEPTSTARLKITNVEVREVFGGVEISGDGLLPTAPSTVKLGDWERSFGDIYAGTISSSFLYTGGVDSSYEIRGERLVTMNYYSYGPGEILLGSGWSEGDWRIRVDEGDIVFELYDDTTWDWIEKHRISASE